MITHTLVCVAAAAFFFQALAEAAPLEIVRNGAAVSSIVVDAAAHDSVKESAQVLSDMILKSTGADVPVRNSTPADGNVIYVGEGEWTARFGIDQRALERPGSFELLFPDERSLVIAGPERYRPPRGFYAHGTEFGVYEFLERFVGVRWLMPGEHGTDVPEKRDIVVERADIREEPAFFLRRTFSGMSRGKDDALPLWHRISRAHWTLTFHHNLWRLFPAETYVQTHPHFFAMDARGERKSDAFQPRGSGWHPCFTADGLVEEAVKNIVRYFDDNPAEDSYSLGINDGTGHCLCPDCLSAISGEANSRGVTCYSDLYYAWANEVVRRVLEQHPGKYFGLLTYGAVADPPKDLGLHPNIVPFITSDRMRWAFDGSRRIMEETHLAWHERAPTLGWYDYVYGARVLLPRVYPRLMAEYYRFAYENGVRGLYAEAYPNWGEGPKLYVSLKLQWDPYRDIEALLTEWYDRCVGEDAAPYLAEYYDFFERFWTERLLETRFGRRFFSGTQVGHFPFGTPTYLGDISPEELARMRRLMEEVVRKTRTPSQQERARILFRAFEFYETSALLYQAREQTFEPGELPTAFPRLLALSERYEEMLSDVLPGCSVLHNVRNPYFEGMHIITTLLWRHAAQIRESDEAKRLLSAAAAGAKDPRVAEVVRELLAGSGTRAETPAGLEAEPDAGWQLVFRDDFDRNVLGEDWEELYGLWAVLDGELISVTPGRAELVTAREFPGFQRIEFEAIAGEPVGDLTPYIHASYGYRTGYFLQFGGQGNTFNRATKLAEFISDNTDTMVTPGKVHRIRAEFDGRHVRLTVDGEIVHEVLDYDPLLGSGHERIGLYVWSGSSTRIRNVRIYTRPATR